ncbi:MAG TPA: hypothetical protein VGN11_12280 [Candidatus Baltobacteraceae bacterium]|jgi:hypothetical protein|nr:hypothetical protein [Candidatus Baltobacteraceae bacterium]
MFVLAVMLSIMPWHGADLRTATVADAKYRLTIAGRPGQTVHLTARGVSDGWIAAFCDNRVCSPMRVTETIHASGKTVIQFELIREAPNAARTSGASIVDDRGHTVAVRSHMR